MSLWMLRLLLVTAGAALYSASPLPHDGILLLLGRAHDISSGLVVLRPDTSNHLALVHDEGLEVTEEGTEGIEDYNDANGYQNTEDYQHEAEGNDGRYIPDTINYDVDESENVTKYEDYQELTTSSSKMNYDYDYHSEREGRADEKTAEEADKSPVDTEEVQLAPVVIQIGPKSTTAAAEAAETTTEATSS